MKLIGIILAAIVAIWVYWDAKKRGNTNLAAICWMSGVFLLMVVFLPLYFFIRSRGVRKMDILTPCSYCGKHYEGVAIYCPNCGHKIGGYSFNKED